MKTVIKFAGALLEDDATMRSLARQVAVLANEGHEILVVHGGGRAFTEALKRTQGNVPEAAKLLAIGRATLYRKIEEYGIQR